MAEVRRTTVDRPHPPTRPDRHAAPGAGDGWSAPGATVIGGPPVPAGDLDGLRILHADMDAFYASVEIRRNPSLAGRPVLVAGPLPRGVVTSASYAARVRGCRNGMPTGMALRLCPDAVVIPPDFAHYHDVSRTVMAAFREVTPLVEPLSLDEAFLDVAGATRLASPAPAIAAALRARVREETGLAVTVGVAANKFLAKLASAHGKPDGLLVVPPSRAVGWLHGLDVKVLWGVGEATRAVLARYGIATVGDLARTPVTTLEAALGRTHGRRLHELAWGRDDRPVVPDQAAKSVGAEETFAADIDDPDTLAREVLRCAVRVGRRLRAASLAGRTITLKVRFADFTTVTRARTLPAPVDTDAEIGRVAQELLADLRIGRRPVRLAGVSIGGLVGPDDPVQLTLDLGGDTEPGARVVGDDRRWEAVDRAADEVRARFGDDAVGLASLLDEPAQAFRAARDEPRARRDL